MDVDAFLARTAELESANADLFAAMATVISKSRKPPPSSPGEASAGTASGADGGVEGSGGSGSVAAAPASASEANTAGTAPPAASTAAAAAPTRGNDGDDAAADGSSAPPGAASARIGGDTALTASVASPASTKKEWSPATVARLTSDVAAGRERLGLDGSAPGDGGGLDTMAAVADAAAGAPSLVGSSGGGGAPPSAQKQVPKQAEFVNQLTTDVVAHARHVAAEHLRLRAAVAELQTENARMTRMQSHRKGRRV